MHSIDRGPGGQNPGGEQGQQIPEQLQPVAARLALVVRAERYVGQAYSMDGDSNVAPQSSAVIDATNRFGALSQRDAA